MYCLCIVSPQKAFTQSTPTDVNETLVLVVTQAIQRLISITEARFFETHKRLFELKSRGPLYNLEQMQFGTSLLSLLLFVCLEVTFLEIQIML